MVTRVGRDPASALRGRRDSQLVDDRQEDVGGVAPVPEERQTVSREVALVVARYENHINTDTAKVDWTI